MGVFLTLTLNPYFNRLWVVQELNLGRSVKVMYGDCLFDWNSVLRFLEPYMASIQVITDSVKQLMDGSNAVINERPDPFLMARLRLYIAGDPIEQQVLNAPRRLGKCVSLPLLLALTWDSRCGEPRDHIFALLNVAKPLERLPSIKVDYSEPVEKIYLAAAHHFLRGSGDEAFESGVECYWEGQGLEPLQALSFIQRGSIRIRHSYTSALPSWAPDLSSFFTTRMIFQPTFSAALNSPLMLELNVKEGIPGTTLRLSGVELDFINRIETKSSEASKDLEPDKGAWLDIAAHLPKTYEPTKETRLRVFISTLNAGDRQSSDQLLTFCQVLATATQTPKIQRPQRTVAELQAVVCALRLPEEELPSQGPLEEIKPQWTEEAPPYMAVSMRFYNSRRFFMSTQGYFGLGPGDMQDGDVIVLVAGARMPFVMRRRRGTHQLPDDGTCKKYSFIGEAYVHGIMHGEAISAVGAQFANIELE